MLETLPPPKQPAQPGVRPPPLENGDHLSAPEFLRRYEGMPQIKKAELIEGVVYMGSPVRYAAHAAPDTLTQLWLATYAAYTPGTQAATNGTIQLDIDNVPQPDSLLRLLPECGGQSHVDAEDYLVGGPELIVEIAASSASNDLRGKLHAYRRNGVQEYLVWRTLDKAFDWLVLVEGEYRPHQPEANHIFHSVNFPGLRLAVKALLAHDAATVLAVLHAGLKSRTHKAFVINLAARKANRKNKA